MKRPDVSIVLLTWNRASMLKVCLERMYASLTDGVSKEVIIMDNCSSDGTKNILSKYESRPDTQIIYSDKNLRLNAYKVLFSRARGRVIIEVDDDVIDFPKGFEKTFLEYMAAFPDYGYFALNVEQNEKTNGAMPDIAEYKEDVRQDKVILEGPVGGWCAAFYRCHYRLFKPFLNLFGISMKRGEDGMLCGLMKLVFHKRQGIIKNAVCLHAVGPIYAKEFGLLDREIEKYSVCGLDQLADKFKNV